LPPKPVAGVGIELKVEPSGFVVGAGKLDVVDKLGVKDEPVSLFGAGETGVGLVAASIALPLRSLSLPANIMPDKVPVKNVAIGIINSKNFWSIGEIAFSG
jgi:hypothetical protein